MSLRLSLIYMHQAQLGQLAHNVFKMVRLRGPKRHLARERRLRLCSFFDNVPLGCTSLATFLLGQSDPDRSLLLDLISFHFVWVTHYLWTKQKQVGMDLFSLVSGYSFSDRS